MQQQNSEIVQVYMDWISQPARAVVACCKLARVQHNLSEIRVMKGEQFTEAFKEINPNQKVPAIVDGKFSLFESHSIMRYLCDSRDTPDHLYPKRDVQKRAKIDAYLDWHHLNTRLPMVKVMLGTMTGKEADVKQYTPQVEQTLKFFESFWLKEGPFIGGNQEISIADISAYCEIIALLMVGYKFEAYPKVKTWLERVGKIGEIAQAHEVFFKILTKMNKTKL